MRLKTFSLIILILLALAGPGQAATYYLDSRAELGGGGDGTATAITVGNELLTDGELDVWTNATTLTNWNKSVSGTSSVNQETVNQYSGAACLRVDLDASASNAYIATKTNRVTSGTRYKLTFEAKATAAFTITPANRGANFRALPPTSLTTAASKITTVGCRYNSTRGKWLVYAVAQEE